MTNEAFQYVITTEMEKKADTTPDPFLLSIRKAQGVLGAATAAIGGGMLLKRIYDKINNDIRRKAIIEDLSMNDPVLKNVDKAQLMEWYATIYKFAPSVSADKASTREVLQGFARFGRVDMQTLKLLVETEKNVASVQDPKPWANLLGTINF